MSEADLSSELNFDKKKKKKKTLALDLDEDGKAAELSSLEQRAKLDEEANEALFGEGDGTSIDTSQFDEAPLELTKKKKKKKDKVLDLDLGDDGIDELGDEIGDLKLEKKKKKKKNVDFKDEAEEGEEAPTEKVGSDDQRPWLKRDMGAENPYLYEELMNRVYGIIESKNPAGIGGPQKLTMRPPSLARVGTKKICYTNFRETANALKRKEEHLMCFIFAELGTTGNQDANGQLVLKGKFNAKSMEKVLRQYIKDFVRCKTCMSPETTLNKRDRLYFLKCDKCQSERSVQAIKTGFQAVVGKRSRLRTAAAAAAPK